jgi:hypothetical protein
MEWKIKEEEKSANYSTITLKKTRARPVACEDD